MKFNFNLKILKLKIFKLNKDYYLDWNGRPQYV